MISYEYFSPKTLDELLDLLESADEHTHIIAGGTDIVLDIRSGRVKPTKVININKIKELKYVKEEEGYIKIGSMMTFTELERNQIINDNAKILAKACSEVGSTQIRNLGTVGGNIVNASAAADSVAALTGLDAQVVLTSKKGQRTMRLVDFYDNGKTKIRKDEVLTEIFFEKPSENTATCFTKLGRRKALAIVVLSFGALIEKDELNRCTKAQFVLGAVAKHPMRIPTIEEKIIGKELNRENLYGLLDDMSTLIYNTILEGSPNRLRSANYKSKSIVGIAKTTFDSILSDLNIE